MISVTDGTVTASLAAFSLSVTQSTGTGVATLSWTTPTTNTDGTSLTDLAGFRVYFGSSATSLSQYVQITDVATTSYVVQGLSNGTWYFAVKAYTSAGSESSLSNVGSKTI
jgi:hypothetical protein